MKTSAVFINVGRGPVVDEKALVEVLNAEQIAGAYLDVFPVEPLPADSAFWTAKNLLISPHNADFTERYATETLTKFLELLSVYEEKRDLTRHENSVNIDKGY